MQQELENQFTYHSPNAEQVERMRLVRMAALQFALVLDLYVPNSADKSAAIRKLRESVMTANAAIVLEPGISHGSANPKNVPQAPGRSGGY